MARLSRRNKARIRKRKPRTWKPPRIRMSLAWLALPFAAMARRCNAGTLRRGMIGLAWAIAAIAAVGAWILGVPRLQAFATDARFASNVEIRFASAPAWVTDDIMLRLLRTAQLHVTGDPLQNHDLVNCREALLSTGWFESIPQVRRVRPNLIEIDAQFAHPYTVIRDAEGDHLVDVVGRLLPLRWPLGEADRHTRLVVISGAHFPRPQTCGTQWEGTDVIAGIRLLQLIEQQSWKSQVTEIDITGYVRGGPMRLRTDAGATIVWGGAPGEEPALEVLADGKLRRLNALFNTYGRIDAGERGEIDITNEKAVVTRKAE